MSQNISRLLEEAIESLKAYRQQLPRGCGEYKRVSDALRHLSKGQVFYSFTMKAQEEEDEIRLAQSSES